MKSDSFTHVGLRRSNNEDRFFADDNLGLYVVSDGMGGHRSGEIAAQTVIDTFVGGVRNGQDMDRAANASNIAVIGLEGGVSYRSPGATLTALRINGHIAEICHAGDSEMWLWRNGEPIRKMTKDHTDWSGCLLNFPGVGTDFFVQSFQYPVKSGDRFLIASDGLSAHFDPMRSTTIIGFMTRPSIQGLASDIVEKVLERGANDNVTVIVVEV